MTPAEKKAAVACVESHRGEFNVACCKELMIQHSILLKDLQNFRVCYELAKENPEQLDMELPPAEVIAEAEERSEVIEAFEAMPKVTKGLKSFELKPEGLQGEELLDHMVRYGKRVDARNPGHCDVRPGDIEMSDSNKAILEMTAEDFGFQSLLREAGGTGASLKMPQRRLNAFGSINNECCFANDPTRLGVLRNRAEMASSIAEIEKLNQEEKKKKASDTIETFQKVAPVAIEKLSKHGNVVSKLTKEEIASILFVCYSKTVSKSAKKGTIVNKLQQAIAADHGAALKNNVEQSNTVLLQPVVGAEDDEQVETTAPPRPAYASEPQHHYNED